MGWRFDFDGVSKAFFRSLLVGAGGENKDHRTALGRRVEELAEFLLDPLFEIAVRLAHQVVDLRPGPGEEVLGVLDENEALREDLRRPLAPPPQPPAGQAANDT